jgi:ATP-dependent helicase/nuclease subunit B
MLKIIFDFSFDRGCWPGPLQRRDAAVGDIWAGPSGLLDMVETFTGLRAPVVPQSLRVAALIGSIFSVKGFWDRSALVDPFGCAQKILEWRDYLWLHGWRGQPCSSPRIDALAKVTKALQPGIPDRLIQAVKAIHPAGNAITDLTLTEPLSVFPHRWLQLIQALGKSGTTIHVPQQGAGFHPPGMDPTACSFLQLLRPGSWGAAAHETAAWLSGSEDVSNTVIIGPDMFLDEALYRFGLPTTGAGTPVYDNALLQILPLVLEMAWHPPDPQRALELLMLPISPVPPSMSRRLIHALQKFPAVGSEAWQTAMDEGLSVIDDSSRRARLKKRLDILFATPIEKNRYPASHIRKRIDMIRTWTRGQMGVDKAQLDWHPLIAQLENAEEMVTLSGLEAFTAPQIRHMLSDITNESRSAPLFEDQAGIYHVGAPECIWGKADTIIWWSFTQESAGSMFTDPFTDSEKKALKKIGVCLPDPGALAVRLAGLWQRPLQAAEKHLILVCPRTDTGGEQQFPHPLWDELTGQQEEKTIVAAGKPVPVERKPVSLPGPIDRLTISPGFVRKSPRESSNSLSMVLSCPFRWVVAYPGNISGGYTPTLSTPEELEGWFIHEVLARVLKKGMQTPLQAGQNASRIFDRDGPLLAATYFLPGWDSLREKVRNATKIAAEQLYHTISDGGFTIDSVEKSLELPISSKGITLNGRPDLVLKNPLAVIDFKRGGVEYRTNELSSGTSVQLAVYGRLLADGNRNSFPATAYFMVKAGRLITCDSRLSPRAVPVDGIPPEQTWRAVKNSYAKVRQELDQGIVRIPGNDESPLESSELTDEGIALTPCAFCDFGVLCGNAFSGESS